MIRNTNFKNLYKGLKKIGDIKLSNFNRLILKNYTNFYSSDFSESNNKKSN